VIEKVAALIMRQGGIGRAAETVPLPQALNRVMSQQIVADRDYPPFHRATRDGFAVRSADCSAGPAKLTLIGEVRAGDSFTGEVGPGECVQIMTGAPVPRGADAVVMIEHTEPGEEEVAIKDRASAGQNVVAAGCEARKGEILLQAGTRLGYAEMAIAAQVGAAQVSVTRRPRMAVLSTGDEVVNYDERPRSFQIRNTNNISLSAQAMLACAAPIALGNVPDSPEDMRVRIERGLKEDVLVISGGVSKGKYDLVEAVLQEMGGELFFDAVAIRPGKPAVFGICRNKPVFGLPGNPVSTMVTFELLVTPALDLLSGTQPRPLALLKARVGTAVKEKAALTHFLPAQLTWDSSGAVVKEIDWQGSGDIVALAQANCFLVVPESRLEIAVGEWADVLPIRGAL
jgi:molybdopterin molybdotransferase